MAEEEEGRQLTYTLKGQEAVEKFYNGLRVQVGVAILISANFLTNIVEKEIDPHGDKYEDVFGGFELFYNIAFTIELGINIYAHWFCYFWISGWNIFDVIVVSIGIMTTVWADMPPALGLLRMMRAFRVFRLFNRVHSLNKIIVAIVHAVPGVVNAFLILAIVMSIYAILAVEFYYYIGEDCTRPDGDSRFKTPRGYCAGEEYFGTFTKSLYSFFQVLTGESWSEAVARPAIWAFYDEPLKAVGSGLFFVSYVLITAFVLTNVVVAVLLDKMVDPDVAEAAAAIVEGDDDGEKGEDGETNPDILCDTIPNGGPATPEDLQNTISTVVTQVDQLTSVSERMSTDLDLFRNEMAFMREQVASILQCVPGGNNEPYK